MREVSFTRICVHTMDATVMFRFYHLSFVWIVAAVKRLLVYSFVLRIQKSRNACFLLTN